jgi:hypothetical protein
MTEKRKGKGWRYFPKGWTRESVVKWFETMGGSVDAVAKKLKDIGIVDDPYAMAASAKDIIEGSTMWRSKRNPSVKISQADAEKAVKIHKKFFGRYPESLNITKWQGGERYLVSLGTVSLIEYHAQKHDDKMEFPYRHIFDKKVSLFYDPVNNAMVITGDFEITEAGIEG